MIAFWFLVAAIVGICNYSAIEGEEEEINKCSSIKEATIDHVFKNTGGTRLKYCFELKNRKYCDSDWAPWKYKKCANDSKCVGDTITIEYSRKNPEYSRIYYKKK